MMLFLCAVQNRYKSLLNKSVLQYETAMGKIWLG